MTEDSDFIHLAAVLAGSDDGSIAVHPDVLAAAQEGRYVVTSWIDPDSGFLRLRVNDRTDECMSSAREGLE